MKLSAMWARRSVDDPNILDNGEPVQIQQMVDNIADGKSRNTVRCPRGSRSNETN